MAASRELHEDAAALARSVRDEGFPDWGRALEDAVAGGCTGTEILMALRWTTEKLLRARLPLGAPVRAQSRGLVAAIDDALGG